MTIKARLSVAVVALLVLLTAVLGVFTIRSLVATVVALTGYRVAQRLAATAPTRPADHTRALRTATVSASPPPPPPRRHRPQELSRSR